MGISLNDDGFSPVESEEGEKAKKGVPMLSRLTNSSKLQSWASYSKWGVLY